MRGCSLWLWDLIAGTQGREWFVVARTLGLEVAISHLRVPINHLSTPAMPKHSRHSTAAANSSENNLKSIISAAKPYTPDGDLWLSIFTSDATNQTCRVAPSRSKHCWKRFYTAFTLARHVVTVHMRKELPPNAEDAVVDAWLAIQPMPEEARQSARRQFRKLPSLHCGTCGTFFGRQDWFNAHVDRGTCLRRTSPISRSSSDSSAPDVSKMSTSPSGDSDASLPPAPRALR
ncbi:hypothetical protein BKA62DRAFT_86802 [Auriculariales sp. MPI-PUGE-AT-0066]|nr:hypothetical protein BKA62DRAFT_86802 [Auriculariales sp. MPI-PUGE-AT-0066]